MTTDRSGDEPALGGRSDDLTPMISSVQTRAIADARGAYIVGNLRALVERMTAQQQMQFKHFIVSDVVSKNFFWTELTPDDHLAPLNEPAISAVRAWLNHPDDQTLQEVAVAWEFLQSVLPRPPELTWLVILMRGITAPGYEGIRALMICYLQILRPIITDDNRLAQDALGNFQMIISLIRPWFLDVAWHILTGSESVPSPTIDLDTLAALRSQPEQLVQTGNLADLLRLLNADQQARFQAVVVSGTVRYLQKILPQHPYYALDAAWLNTFEQWCQQGKKFDNSDRGRLRTAERATPRRDLYFRAIKELFYCFLPDSSAQQVAQHCSAALGYVQLAEVGESNIDGAWMESEYTKASQWQVQVAWAILNDAPIPPLDART
jgi:hypothetical protein